MYGRWLLSKGLVREAAPFLLMAVPSPACGLGVFMGGRFSWVRPEYGFFTSTHLELSHMAMGAQEAGSEDHLCAQGDKEMASEWSLPCTSHHIARTSQKQAQQHIIFILGLDQAMFKALYIYIDPFNLPKTF